MPRSGRGYNTALVAKPSACGTFCRETGLKWGSRLPFCGTWRLPRAEWAGNKLIGSSNTLSARPYTNMIIYKLNNRYGIENKHHCRLWGFRTKKEAWFFTLRYFNEISEIRYYCLNKPKNNVAGM